MEFQNAAIETKAEKKAKGFTSWNQFVAMIFCQLGQAHSLREICGGLATCLGKVKRLGIKDAPSRSTLCYANELRRFSTNCWQDANPWQREKIPF